MLKYFGLTLVLLLVISSLPAAAYTVVLKSGKVLKGTLVSETDEKIVFKDEQGLQFSLKKTVLDADKTKEANAAAPAAAPEAAPVPEPATPAKAPSTKPSKVYTAADIEALRKKYSNAISGTSGESLDVSTPSGYYKGLMEAVSRITGSMNDMGSLLDGMNTDWELASSTGRNPAASFAKYKTGKVYTELSRQINANLSELKALRDSMQSPPKGYEGAAGYLSESVDSLYNYFGAIQQYNGDPAIGVFRMSLQKYSNEVDSQLSKIQGMPAPPEDQPPATPDNTNQDNQQ